VIAFKLAPISFAIASIFCCWPSSVILANESLMIISAAAITRGSSPSERTICLAVLRARFFSVFRRFTADSKYHGLVGWGLSYGVDVATSVDRLGWIGDFGERGLWD